MEHNSLGKMEDIYFKCPENVTSDFDTYNSTVSMNLCEDIKESRIEPWFE